MANSNWTEADKQCQQKQRSIQEAFQKYLLWFIATGEGYLCDGGWCVGQVRENLSEAPLTVELIFSRKGLADENRHWLIRSLEDWEEALILNYCPVPMSLTTILGEYRQGRDGKDAVEFYTQTGDTF